MVRRKYHIAFIGMSRRKQQKSHAGVNTLGVAYGSLDALWTEELGVDVSAAAVDDKAVDDDSSASEALREQWYNKGAQYWASVPPTVDGVLGGFGTVSPVDIEDSANFLEKIGAGTNTAVDCGAGIGRIALNLFVPRFQRVDIVEQNPAYTAQARQDITSPKLVGVYTVGLQNWRPEAGLYDVIWIQWVIGHLHDADMVAFLKRCVEGLSPNGVICVKENVSKDGKFIMDKEDNSITRGDAHFRNIFWEAGLSVTHMQRQTRFPSVLLPVNMYALKVRAVNASNDDIVASSESPAVAVSSASTSGSDSSPSAEAALRSGSRRPRSDSTP